MDVLLYSFIAAYTGKDPNTMKLNPFPDRDFMCLIGQ